MKKIISIILLSLSGLCLKAQSKLDSLLFSWNNKELVDSVRAHSYYSYVNQKFINTNPDTAFILSHQLIDFAKEKNSLVAQYYGLRLQGDSWYERAIYTKAIDCYLKCADISKQTNDLKGIAHALHMLGNIYYYQQNEDKALEYWTNSLSISEQVGNKNEIAKTAANIGLIYQIKKDYPKAIEQMTLGLRSSESVGDPYGISNFLHNIGAVYFDMKDYNRALEYMSQSLKIAEENKLDNMLATNYVDMGLIYEEQNNFSQAKMSCQKGYNLAVSLGDFYLQKGSCDCLYIAFKASGEIEKALTYHELFNAIEDSLQTTETANKLQEMEYQKQAFADSLATVEKERAVKEAYLEQVRQKNKLRNILIGAVILVLIFSLGIYSRLRYVRKTKAIIETEKNRSDNLLLNILPADIAAELKEKGHVNARDFETVSILFTDFIGFTVASEKLSAQELVAEINTCFKAFDEIVTEYGIEKIKTIGDAYMAAGGIPLTTDASVKNTVCAALKMQQFILTRCEQQKANRLPFFEMRLGIHTGPVVAGVVGIKKFQYDIWGDTVNIASRMESAGDIGKVNISQTTYELLKNDSEFTFESRGKVEVKGKGEMEMYFVETKLK